MYSSWVDCALDVLATSPKQLDAIANLLQEPSAEFLRWSVLPYWPPPKPGEIKRYRKLLAFKAVKNLEYAAKGVSKARSFHHSVIHSDDVLIDVYLTQVSTAFPGAIFLLD